MIIKDRTIILLYFGFINGRRYTQSEIAEILSISQAYLSVIMPQSINKVKIQLIKSGFYELRTSNLYNDSCINNNQRLIMGRK